MGKKSEKSVCINCKKEFYFNSQLSKGKYCSNKCQLRFQRVRSIENGTAGWRTLRTYIKEESNGKCKICGISQWLGDPILLIVDHIDGDSTNNSLDNLRAICSNCDATLSTYKSRNRGMGRSERMERYKKGLSY